MSTYETFGDIRSLTDSPSSPKKLPRHLSGWHIPWTGPFGGKSSRFSPALKAALAHEAVLSHSFAITHGPTPAERVLMEEWIETLVAFVNGSDTYEHGTKTVEEMKVMTPEGTIEIRPDNRWDELVSLGKIFAGN